ncbi:hypothetical protein PYCC9005_004567 [Savitreella phatthalungensis]
MPAVLTIATKVRKRLLGTSLPAAFVLARGSAEDAATTEAADPVEFRIAAAGVTDTVGTAATTAAGVDDEGHPQMVLMIVTVTGARPVAPATVAFVTETPELPLLGAASTLLFDPPATTTTAPVARELAGPVPPRGTVVVAAEFVMVARLWVMDDVEVGAKPIMALEPSVIVVTGVSVFEELVL